jgi:hypothetical protein
MIATRVRMCRQLRNFRSLINPIDWPELYTGTAATGREFIGFVRMFFTLTDDELRYYILAMWLTLDFVHATIRSGLGYRVSLVELDYDLHVEIADSAYEARFDDDRWDTAYAKAYAVATNALRP